MRPVEHSTMKNIVLVFSSTLLTLAMIEVALRASHWATDVPFVEGDSQRGFKYIPNQTGYHVKGPLGNEKTRFHINSNGWNSISDYKENHDPGVFRIAFIGDSYIEAVAE